MSIGAERDTAGRGGAPRRRGQAARAKAFALGAVVAGTVGLVAAQAAQAGERYYHGSPTNNVVWPPCLSAGCQVASMGLGEFLTESTARTVNGNTVCAAATDTSVVCSSDLAVKPLSGDTIRSAFSRGAWDAPRPQGRARGAW